jgi:hypothetical protein
MADVFISCARIDKARVAPLVAAIEARGWTPWWDPDMDPIRGDPRFRVLLEAAEKRIAATSA